MVDKLYTSEVGLCSLNTSTSFLLLLEMASGKEVSIAAFSSAALVPKRGSQLDENLVIISNDVRTVTSSQET